MPLIGRSEKQTYSEAYLESVSVIIWSFLKIKRWAFLSSQQKVTECLSAICLFCFCLTSFKKMLYVEEFEQDLLQLIQNPLRFSENDEKFKFRLRSPWLDTI